MCNQHYVIEKIVWIGLEMHILSSIDIDRKTQVYGNAKPELQALSWQNNFIFMKFYSSKHAFKHS